MDEKAKPTPKFSKNGWICQVWMKTSQMSGCKAFSIQKINEYWNMWLHHNTFWCQPSISSQKKNNVSKKKINKKMKKNLPVENQSGLFVSVRDFHHTMPSIPLLTSLNCTRVD
jgi:hypothetical protein